MPDSLKVRSRSAGQRILALCLSWIVIASVSVAQEMPKPIQIGVLAKRGYERCQKKWQPTAEYLSNRLPGYSFTIIPLNYDEVYAAVERKEIHFILANPSFYVELERLYGVSRMLTLKNLRLGKASSVFGGVIFYRAERKDIKHLNDLRGKRFVAVDEKALAGWQAAWRELKENGINPYRDFSDLSFLGTHDAVVYAVRDGKFDAGSVRTDALERMAMEGKIRLEDFYVMHEHYGDDVHLPFLHSTRAYPEWPFAKARHTSDQLAEKVAAVLLRMSPDCPTARAGRYDGWTIPLNYQSVHECLKYLRVDPYRDYGKITLRSTLQQYWSWLLGALAAMILLTLFTVYIININRQLRQAMAGQWQELIKRKRAEDVLRETSSFLECLIRCANAPIIVWDPDFKITRFNNAFERLTGYEAGEVVGQDLCILFPKQAREQALKKTGLAIRGEPWESVEIPIRCKSGEVRIVLWNSANISSPDETSVLATIAQGIDITERKQAEIKLLDYQQQLQALASELSLTEERERRCLAMQLHDSIGQLLAFSKMRLTTISQHANLPSNVSQAINETKEQIESAIKHTRTLISELSPPVLYELEFSDAIEWLTERTGAEHSIRVDVEVGSEAISPPENIRVVLFQATRELLANVVKHAQATHAKVTMRRKCDHVEIEVTDNGVGFDGASVDLHRNGSGFGLFNIRERLNLLGGNMQINSKPGGKSRITLIAPLHNESFEHEGVKDGH